MLYFKRLIQIPRLPEVLILPSPHATAPGSFQALDESPKGLWRWPRISHLSLQGPPNFLRASALAEHIKPVVVIPEEAPEDEEPENLIEISSGPPAGEPVVSCHLLASPCPTVTPQEEGLCHEAGRVCPSTGHPPPWRAQECGAEVHVFCYGRWWLTSLIRPLDHPMAP